VQESELQAVRLVDIQALPEALHHDRAIHLPVHLVAVEVRILLQVQEVALVAITAQAVVVREVAVQEVAIADLAQEALAHEVVIAVAEVQEVIAVDHPEVDQEVVVVQEALVDLAVAAVEDKT